MNRLLYSPYDNICSFDPNRPKIDAYDVVANTFVTKRFGKLPKTPLDSASKYGLERVLPMNYIHK